MAKRKRAGGKRASSYNRCVGNEMRGRKFGSRRAATSALRAAAKKCKGR